MSQSNSERRQRLLTDADIEALSVAVHGGVSPEEHIAHHAAIKTMIDRENRKAERAERLKTQVGGWAIITMLGLIGKATWTGWLYVRDHLK